MNQYIEKLTAYIKENLLDGGQGETESVLALLEEYYLAENPVNSAQIKELEDKIGPIYEELPFEWSSKLFTLIYDLCGGYEKAAFHDGVQIGFRLCQELGREGR